MGNSGSGSLQVLNGATASTLGNSYLGVAPGSMGSAIVRGDGSMWNTTRKLVVGGDLDKAGGLGALTVQSGGVVSAGEGIIIRSTGALTGDGTIIGKVTNEGTVAPGNSPGVLQIDGDYEQPENGVLKLQLAGPDSAAWDHLVVAGDVTIL
jgi:T5SS/PEP-CTERM-associated repeat protein